ncbi:MAG: serine/threonine phosphatase PrpC [Myxococcaceae bacterium]|nr:serine/threonine phosphatase PrpC [Myxococcaceae bacterium]
MADKPNIQPSAPAVEIAVRTDPGRDPEKQVNEDAAAHTEVKLGLLAVVCDGMGGHAGGKEASELAVKSIVEIVTAAPEKTAPRDALRVAIEEANRRVWGMPTNEGGYRPGSTVVAILAHAGGAEVAHVGDSRIYLVHSGAITQVTKDHSMVQEMVDRNIIKAEEAAKHPDANKIMRALGIAKDVEVDVRPEPIAYVAGDVFILCSDGLSDLVTASEILDIAGSRPAAQAAGQLVDLANARGGHDNITAMVVRMKGSASSGDAATIVKTMPLTAHAPVSASAAPAEPGAGPRGTVLTAPLQPTSSPNVDVPSAVKTVLAAPVAAPARSDATPAIPPAPRPSSPPSERGERSKVPLIAGIVLVLVALGIVAAFVWTQQRPHRAPVVIVPFDASRPATIEEDAGMVAPDITLAPVLAPPSGVKVPWWKDPDAATPTGEPRECAIARWRKDAGQPSSTWDALEAKCRAAGGKP